MADIVINNPPPVGNANRIHRPQAKQDAQNPNVNEQDKDVFIGPNNNPPAKKGFNIFSFSWGLIKGFVKEAITIALFIPKLVINLITNPVDTIKGFVNGFIVLGKLLSNPSELGNVLKNAWEAFKNADSDEKGQIIGRILCNFVPLPIVGNPLLLNIRLLSSMRRFGVGINAIARNTRTLARFHRMNGCSRWRTFLAARRIAKRENLLRDFQKSLRLEGISGAIAPRLVLTSKLNILMVGGYTPMQHIIYINKAWLNFLPSGMLGKIIRHEVKHSGQALLAARAGGRIPQIRMPNGQLVDFMPSHIWNNAHQIAPITPGSPLYQRASLIPQQFEVSFRNSAGAVNISGNFWANFRAQRNYLNDILEIEARAAQNRYTGLMPRIFSPSIHNVPRLAPLADG